MNPSSASTALRHSPAPTVHPDAQPASTAGAGTAAHAPAAAPRQSGTRVGGGNPAGNTALGTRPAPAGNEPAAKRLRSSDFFSHQESAALRGAKKVAVLEYSSTGGGHTARSLDPIVQAAKDGTFKKGDCVVILAPPRWQHDLDGGKVNTLHDKVKDLHAQGLNVIVKQGDKTITGLYKRNGDSDNVAMLLDFVNKPKRLQQQTPLSTARASRENAAENFPKGQGVPAKRLLDEVVSAVHSLFGKDHQDKIVVVGDMAPALQAAASAKGIDKSLEIGNHQKLFIGDGRDQLGEKNLAYLHKASGGGHAEKLALVQYAGDVNVVQDLKPTMAALGIEPGMSKTDARNKVLQHVLDHGKKLDLTPNSLSGSGILAGPTVREPKDVKALVYLYVNQYTEGAVNHIRQQIAAKPDTFGKCVFAVCGKGALEDKDNKKLPKDTGNILQVMYAANADGVTNAGFGTTSEFHYMASKGYKGDFIAFPVVNQHEQEANASMLVAAAPEGRVTDATGPAMTMHKSLDALVQRRCAQDTAHQHLGGPNSTMQELFDASASPTSGPQHAANLLASLYAVDHAGGEQMRPEATASIAAMQAFDETHSAKQSRRIYKLFVPALDAIRKGQMECAIRATSKVGETRMLVSDVVAHLKAISNAGTEASRQAATDLMGVEFDNANARTLAGELGDQLEKIISLREFARSGGRAARAQEALVELAEKKVALGW